jgi:hypothetical protein
MNDSITVRNLSENRANFNKTKIPKSYAKNRTAENIKNPIDLTAPYQKLRRLQTKAYPQFILTPNKKALHIKSHYKKADLLFFKRLKLIQPVHLGIAL